MLVPVLVDPVLLGDVLEGVEFFVLRMPPWAVAGTVLPLVFAAAFLNAARVSGPLVLRRGSAMTPNTL